MSYRLWKESNVLNIIHGVVARPQWLVWRALAEFLQGGHPKFRHLRFQCHLSMEKIIIITNAPPMDGKHKELMVHLFCPATACLGKVRYT